MKNNPFSDNKITLYVDASAGTNGDGSAAAPFLSITEARDKIRELKESGITIAVDVMIAPGVYSPLNLDSGDSGSADCPVRYISREPRGAVIKGSMTLNPSDFSPISEEEKSHLISAGAGEQVKKISLTALGLTEKDYGSSPSLKSPPPALTAELYSQGKRLNIGRYPRSGWILIDGVKSNGDGTTSNCCRCPDEVVERSALWSFTSDPLTFGYYLHNWSDSSSAFTIDSENKEITFTDLGDNSLEKDRRYWFYNLFEELSSPGDYYIDRKNGVLYLYTSEELFSSPLELSLGDVPLIDTKKANYISFIGLELCYTRASAVDAKGEHLRFSGIHITGTGSRGMMLRGRDIILEDSEIEETGADGIVTAGGDAASLTPSEIIVRDNYIHGFGKLHKCYYPGVNIYSCGCTVTHNEICDSSHSGILYHGPLNTIEYNYMHDLCNDTADCGAIYSGRSMTYYGNVIRYNYIKDIGCPDIIDDFFCAQGIYLDDGLSGQTVYGNIIENVTGRGIYLGGGRDNTVVNNIIINPAIYSIDPDDRMRDGAFADGWFSKAQLNNMANDIRATVNDIWKEKFPIFNIMKTDYENGDKNDLDLFVIPAGNVIKNNIAYKCKAPRKYDVGKFCFEAICDFSKMHHNYIIENEGGDVSDFYDYEGGDRTVREDSTAKRLIPEFDIIPFDRIGIRKKI
ncbi:MAG: right-handed parallel beta-helix repeat-containing protein [Clostridia bacterium]|nr:right-handed parallel beta-helix repeat-containing protein [Clostridia bacterium]